MPENKQFFQHEINFEIKETSKDEEYFYFEGYGSTADLDLTRDIVEPGAFRASLAKKMPVILWQHNRDEPLGVYEKAEIQNKGLFVRGKMPLDDDFVAKRVIPQLKVKSIKSLSIGFYTKLSEYDRENDIRTIKEVDLHEISLVTFPANTQAVITSLKSFLGVKENKKEIKDLYKHFAPLDYKWNEKEALERVGKDQNFLDAENEQLPIMDMVDGKLLAVPRAIFKARAHLSGIKSHEVVSVNYEEAKNTIDAYYKLMGLEPPFNGGKGRPFCLTEIKNVSKSILAGINRYCELSKEASGYVSALIMADVFANDPGDLGGLEQSLKSLREKLKLKGA